jgi:hypothetical protein
MNLNLVHTTYLQIKIKTRIQKSSQISSQKLLLKSSEKFLTDTIYGI